MKEVKFKTENLLIADMNLLYPEIGMYTSEDLPKVILYRTPSCVINPFDLEDQKILLRYSHIREKRLILTSPKEVDVTSCICYIEDERANTFDRKKEYYTMEELEDYILFEPCFYRDRTSVALKRLKKGKQPFQMMKILLEDRKNREAYQEKISQFEKEKLEKKENKIYQKK